MNRDAKSILIGVASVREDEKFLASLSSLVKQMRGKYRVAVLMEKWQDLATAQNAITDYFLRNGFTYLLLLDDDHAGHTLEMVEALVAADSPMVTMQTHVRHFPYPIALFKRFDSTRMISHVQDRGYAVVDMTGFPMTLFTREVFEKLEPPYFRARCDGGVEWCTDKEFCERLEKVGIKPVGCYDFCLEHDGITKENVSAFREKNAKGWIDRFRLFRSLQTKERKNA